MGHRYASAMLASRRAVLASVVGTALVLGLSACGPASRPLLGPPAAAAPTTTTTIPFRLVATTHDALKSVDVFDAPGAAAPKVQLSNPNSEGAKRVVLVKQQQGTDWLEVLLPVRPNGSTG